MKIIAIEGIDACGKETQAKMLVDALVQKGYEVQSYSFPRYEEAVGALIGKYLKGEVTLTPEAFHMLYAVDRQDFMHTLHLMEVCGYDFLVCDRFTMSNMAFGMAKELDIEWLESLEAKVRKPDITFLLDIPVSVSIARRIMGRDKYESDLKLLLKAREAYLTLSLGKQYSSSENRIIVLDGTQSENDIHQKILQYTIAEYCDKNTR